MNNAPDPRMHSNAVILLMDTKISKSKEQLFLKPMSEIASSESEDASFEIDIMDIFINNFSNEYNKVLSLLLIVRMNSSVNELVRDLDRMSVASEDEFKLALKVNEMNLELNQLLDESSYWCTMR